MRGKKLIRILIVWFKIHNKYEITTIKRFENERTTSNMGKKSLHPTY